MATKSKTKTSSKPANASSPRKIKSGEEEQKIDVGDWVRIGDHKDVDDKYEGHLAVVMDTSNIDYICLDPKCASMTGVPHRHQNQSGTILVRTRDQYSATIEIPLTAVKERSRAGRTELLGLSQ